MTKNANISYTSTNRKARSILESLRRKGVSKRPTTSDMENLLRKLTRKYDRQGDNVYFDPSDMPKNLTLQDLCTINLVEHTSTGNRWRPTGKFFDRCIVHKADLPTTVKVENHLSNDLMINTDELALVSAVILDVVNRVGRGTSC